MNPSDISTRITTPSVKCLPGNGGMTRLEVRSKLAEATLYLLGAHVTHFKPAGEAPVLFMSSRSKFADGAAIRGGVPVCFPWFGAKAGVADAPVHGFVRNKEWDLVRASEAPDGTVEVILHWPGFSSPHWSQPFSLEHRIRVGRTLSMELTASNTGASPLTFQEALHSYIAVADLRKLAVTGLEGATYLDKNDNMARKTAAPGELVPSDAMDRHYVNTASACIVHDRAAGRRIRIAKKGSLSTVVWTPWQERAAKIGDLDPSEWASFICVETTNEAGHSITLAPGASHTMEALIGVEK